MLMPPYVDACFTKSGTDSPFVDFALGSENSYDATAASNFRSEGMQKWFSRLDAAPSRAEGRGIIANYADSVVNV